MTMSNYMLTVMCPSTFKKHTVSGLLQFLALSQSFTYGLEMVGATSKTIATHLAA